MSEKGRSLPYRLNEKLPSRDSQDVEGVKIFLQRRKKGEKRPSASALRGRKHSRLNRVFRRTWAGEKKGSNHSREKRREGSENGVKHLCSLGPSGTPAPPPRGGRSPGKTGIGKTQSEDEGQEKKRGEANIFPGLLCSEED